MTIFCEDFGLAQNIDKAGGKGVRGTLMYMAPEILSGRPYDSRVDLWSIGVILYGKSLLIHMQIDCWLTRMPVRATTVRPIRYRVSNLHHSIRYSYRRKVFFSCRNSLRPVTVRFLLSLGYRQNAKIYWNDYFNVIPINESVFNNFLSILLSSIRLPPNWRMRYRSSWSPSSASESYLSMLDRIVFLNKARLVSRSETWNGPWSTVFKPWMNMLQ